MKEDYCRYSGITIDELDSRIRDISVYNIYDPKHYDNLFYHMLKNTNILTYEALSPNSSIDNSLIDLSEKISIFSPQMISLIINSNYKSALEYIGGLGIFSELLASLKDINVTYSNIDCDISRFVSWRFLEYNHYIPVEILDEDFTIVNNYDVIVSDGTLQYFDEDKQHKVTRNMMDKVDPDGLLCLLVDISGKLVSPLYYDVDINKIHSILDDEMVCIYGKNTFSSLWKKMI